MGRPFIFVFVAFVAQFHTVGLCFAQVSTDGSLGVEIALEGPEFAITHDLGQIRGTNLYHSFEEFGLQLNESATFSGPAFVENIVSRVTGGDASYINGAIRSTIDRADFFILNPSGVVFGPWAELDLKGSFYVSTANYLRFDDGAVFRADLAGTSVLSVANPEAFGFLDDNPASIAVDDSWLGVPSGETLSFVGGDLDIIGVESGAKMKASGGRLQLVGVGEAGEIDLNSPEVLSSPDGEGGKIRVSNAELATDGYEAGTLVIKGGQIQISGVSAISGCVGDIDAACPGIDMEAASRIEINDGSGLMSYSIGRGNGGDIEIASQVATVQGESSIEALSIGSGASGSISLATSEALSLRDASSIQVKAFDRGDGGNIALESKVLTVEDGAVVQAYSAASGACGSVKLAASESLSLRSASSIQVTAFDRGDGGNIELESKVLTIENGAVVQASSAGSGSCGSVKLAASESLLLRDASAIQVAAFDLGDGGNIELESKVLTIENGAVVQAYSAANGACGSVKLAASESLSLKNASSILATAFDRGDGGNIELESKILTIEDGALVRTRSAETGACGSVKLAASESLSLKNASSIQVIVCDQGDGGSIELETKVLTIENGAFVRADSSGIGACGPIMVDAADSVLIDGRMVSGNITGIFSYAVGSASAADISVSTASLQLRDLGLIASFSEGEGDAGAVAINAVESFLIEGGERGLLSFSSGSGAAGEISVSAASLELRNGGTIASASEGEKGSGAIFLSTGWLRMDFGVIDSDGGSGDSADIVIRTDDFQAFNGSAVTAGTSASGNSGMIDIVAENILLEDSDIENGTAGAGNGGDINIETGRLTVRNASMIASSSLGSGTGGDISINADDLTLAWLSGSRAPKIVTSATQSGHAGNIFVDVAGTLRLFDGGAILADTYGTGDAGEIEVSARKILMAGTDPLTSSAISSSFATDATGEGGRIRIYDVEVLRLQDYAFIGAYTLGEANAGAIDINADHIALDGGRIEAYTAGGGNGGAIAVASDSISVRGGGGMTCETQGSGMGGDLKIAANSLLVDGADAGTTGLFADATGDGRAGSILLEVKDLRLHNDARISTETVGAGKGGDVIIKADDLGVYEESAISSASSGTGAGGTLDIRCTGDATIDGAALTAEAIIAKGGDIKMSAGNLHFLNNTAVTAKSTGAGNAGNIELKAISKLYCDESAIDAEAVRADGGEILINTGNMARFTDSQVRASVGGGPETTGGNIDLHSEYVIMNQSDFSANAFEGRGGRIMIDAQAYLADFSSILDASSETGIDGVVDIRAPFADLSGSLKPLPKEFLNAEDLLKAPCEARLRGGDYGSFTVKGRDALPIEPGSLQISPPTGF